MDQVVRGVAGNRTLEDGQKVVDAGFLSGGAIR